MGETGRPRIRIEDLVEKGLWPEDWENIIYDMGRRGKNKTHIMEHFDLHRDTFYKLLKRDTKFADAVNKAMTYSQNYWIKFAEDAFIKGESKNINSNLWSLIMRNQYKEDWSEKQYIDHQTKGEKINDKDIVVRVIPPKDLDGDTDD
jgi:hypothetical protein